VNRPPAPARRHPTGLTAARPPLAALSIRFPHGHRVEIHCQPRSDGVLTVHSSGPVDPGHQDVADVLQLARAGFLTSTGRRGTTAGMIYSHRGHDLDAAVTIADALDLLAGAALTAAGITNPDDARAILATLWAAQ
jgi:hypothetical protein